MNKELVAVYLSPEECILFREFAKRRNIIGLLDSIGFFTFKDGSVTIHIDHFGRIRKVDKLQSFNELTVIA